MLIIIRADGTYTTDDFTILPDEGSIKDWLAFKKKRVEAKGLEPRLFIRPHKEVLPKWVDLVLKQAADQGVTKVVYSYMKD